MISEPQMPEPFDDESFDIDSFDIDSFAGDCLDEDCHEECVGHSAERPPVAGDEDAAELVRLLLDLDDIASGALLLVLCDADRRPVVPVLVTDLPATSSAHEVVGRWLHGVAHELGGEAISLVMARARPGQSFVVDHDRAWHEAVLAACEQASMTLLHAFVVTPHAVIPFPRPMARLVG